MAARRCVANQDYTAQGDDELSFKKGDKVYVVGTAADDKDRVKGVFNGKVGFFPESCIKDTSAKFQAGKASRARAVMDYKAKNDSELSFPKNAIIFIAGKSQNDPSHFKGIYKGKVGTFPSVMVEDASNTQTLARKKKKLEEKEKAKSTWTPPEGYKGLRCKAILSYPGNEKKGELSFGIGDIIEVPEGSNKGKTWQGESFDKSGKFPSEYVMDTATVPESEIDAKIAENKGTDKEKKNSESYAKILNGDADAFADEAGAALEEADEGEVKAQEIGSDKKARKEAEKAAKKAAKGK